MTEITKIDTDVMLVPRIVLDTIAEALASIVQVSGQVFGVLIERLDRPDGGSNVEEDDDPGQCSENEISTSMSKAIGCGPGCTLADPDSGIEDAPHDQSTGREREQVANDVSILPVVSQEHNIFTDQRVPLGISNLQSAFGTGEADRSADTVNMHCCIDHCGEPGTPV